MKCPFCNFEESKVVDSRATDDNTTIRRRRECLNCNKRYTTYEKIEDFPVLVVKKDLARENFNKEKIINGLIIACQKRPVSRKQIEDIAYEIEKSISNRMVTEIASKDIGEMVMDKLKQVDEISYVRFASVYRQFKDINTFLEEIKNLVVN
ncbi:transcriptional repressor NrdR [Clostridium botulinum]|uniref:Transcriptional repressor NrdR n=1 Tax=Clostridium botulinum (strain Eklund 17B / Type B) TaxID=935198 RepID=NRDR_CLOBB|nr:MULTISPECIES: transcriptional regulator NrdR [Clostridium]B2THP9.1 RecName: Full=Transcriptional repressor NrdR [Clostridium botulinum B str. Eklund 17B (NRP)]AIY81133.1 transcriptional regulator NrdR [Clostridium botulinum 202F]KAI3348544.1 transcriptional regulator NrdR [Clostridium botulinum]ACD22965.1 transcriptional regulator NrdR [Clostridium botulinum B str. Eklund 17B (NRP)]KFX58226.1 NrdR family transcriptional regulator [Clostridium botulinum]KFX59119.1 NrdR family transcriptiona